jgi:hypothetical protein
MRGVADQRHARSDQSVNRLQRERKTLRRRHAFHRAEHVLRGFFDFSRELCGIEF